MLVSGKELGLEILGITGVETVHRNLPVERLIEETEIKAPIKTKVAAKHIDIGDFVQNGMIVYELVDTKNLRVGLSFPEYQYTYHY